MSPTRWIRGGLFVAVAQCCACGAAELGAEPPRPGAPSTVVTAAATSRGVSEAGAPAPSDVSSTPAKGALPVVRAASPSARPTPSEAVLRDCRTLADMMAGQGGALADASEASRGEIVDAMADEAERAKVATDDGKRLRAAWVEQLRRLAGLYRTVAAEKDVAKRREIGARIAAVDGPLTLLTPTCGDL